MYSRNMIDLPHKVKAALQNIPPFKKVVVGVSGGMDSVVLTHVLKHLGYEVIIAHLNHDLRGEASEKDEAFVVELAKAWGLPFMSKQAVIPKKGNLESNARTVRYAFLDEVRLSFQADYVAVGHHFDDQIETILMNEKRGAGLRGKRGMCFFHHHLIRPFLDIPRREIEAYAHRHMLDFVTDESNFDLRFQRNYFRHEVIPKLKEDAGFEERIRRLSQEAAVELEALNEAKEAWLKGNLQGDAFDRRAFNPLSNDLKVEILLDLIGFHDVYRPTLNRLLEFIAEGQTGKKLQVKKVNFVIEYDQVRFFEDAKEPLLPMPLSDHQTWGDYDIKVSGLKLLKVRSWKQGDRFQPAGMKGTKKLQDFFVDEKIPRQERSRIPIIVDENDHIICVGDLRFSEAFKEMKEEVRVVRRRRKRY